jgi:hypothetical protein
MRDDEEHVRRRIDREQHRPDQRGGSQVEAGGRFAGQPFGQARVVESLRPGDHLEWDLDRGLDDLAHVAVGRDESRTQ